MTYTTAQGNTRSLTLRDGTDILLDTSWVPYRWATIRIPASWVLILTIFFIYSPYKALPSIPLFAKTLPQCQSMHWWKVFLAWKAPPSLHPMFISPCPINMISPAKHPLSPDLSLRPLINSHQTSFLSLGALILVYYCSIFTTIKWSNYWRWLFMYNPHRLWFPGGQENFLLTFIFWTVHQHQLHRCVIYVPAWKAYRISVPGLMLYCCHLKILSVWTKGSTCLFWTGTCKLHSPSCSYHSALHTENSQ